MDPALVVTIRYGDDFFFSDGDYDDVVSAIVQGISFEVYQFELGKRVERKITFFSDVDWVAANV